MRILKPLPRLSFSASVIALAAGFAAPAAAQPEQTQVTTQQTNDIAECSVIADPAQRQKCLETQGENALPEGGAPSGQEVVVTGSRIKRPNFETLQPSVVIDSAQIEARGFTTLGQAINEQPSFGVPGSSPVGAAQGGEFGSGQSFVNFLGLGSQRTLTLVNGRRFVSSNTPSIFGPAAAGTQVDLNTVNTKLVDRVETIAIGGAPIYGSDAIAGTVNVILKRDYEGLDLDAQAGMSTRGDSNSYRIRGLWGMNFGGGRGNVTIAAEYNKEAGLLYTDRGFLDRGQFFDACPEGKRENFDYCLFSDPRIPALSESGIPTVGNEFLFGLNIPLSPEQNEAFLFGDPTIGFGVFDPNGNQLTFTPGGGLAPIDFGNPTGCIPCGDFGIYFEGGNGFDLDKVSNLLTPLKRYNTNLLTQYEITDNIRLFGEGWFAYSKGTNLRNQPIYNSGLFPNLPQFPNPRQDQPLIISIDNPFLTAEQRAIIQNAIDTNPLSEQNALCIFVGICNYQQDFFYLSRANTDLYSGAGTSATRLFRGVLGLDGTFDVGGREYNWEVVANAGRAVTKGRSRQIDEQNFTNAVDAVLDDQGNIVCAPHENSPYPTLSSSCVPLNLFGTGRNSQAALDYVTAIANLKNTNKQRVYTASVSGPLYTLPGGDLSFALGAEHRKESTAFDPGDFFFGADDPEPTVDTNNDGDPTNDRVPYGRSVPILPVSGSYHTNEVFGELRAPIVRPSNTVPGIYSLELHGAARYVDHSAAGSDWTYTAEGRWGIVRDIALRANYTRAIRAPAITESFNPSSSFFGFATDPCDPTNIDAGPDPATREANCIAAGLPDEYQALSDDRSFPQAIAGNPDLQNEKSKAWSLGTVLNPRFIPGLTISADYVNIKLRQAITSFSATGVVNACYDSPDFPNNQFCDLVQRDEDFQLSYVQTSYFNAAEYRYRGILGALDYRRPTPFLGANSRIGVNVSYQYLRTLTTKADEESAPTTSHGGVGYPRHSAVLNVNYQNGPVGLFTSINYTGKVKFDPDAPDDTYEISGYDSVAFVNAGASFDIANKGSGIGKGMTFRLVVDNIFDTRPPSPFPAGGGTISYFPGVLGRYFRAGASVRF